MQTTPSESSGEPRTGRAAVLKLFLALVSISFLLRIFYAGHLYQDDGLWFTAAEEILRGKALYSEIYFDKPPGLPLLYAALFKLFGAHIIVIRLFTVLYAVGVSAALYLFGSHLYGRKAGMVAAAMFVVFSTTFTTGHVQGLNTDLLMLLPYTAGAYLMTRSVDIGEGLRRRAGVASAGGMLAGVAFQVNPKAAFDLVFFALILLYMTFTRAGREGESPRRAMGGVTGVRAGARAGLLLYACAGLGFMAGSLPFLAYIAMNHALSDYKAYVWDWGSLYASYYPAAKIFGTGLAQTIQYFGLNNTLLVALIFVVAVTVRKPGPDAETAAGAGYRSEAVRRSNVIALAWLAASYAGLAVGGRFFGHYFLQALPALCLTGASGILGIDQWLKARDLRARPWLTRRRVLALLALGFAFTLVRFHGRTAALASDLLRKGKGEATTSWFHERLNREERMAAAAVREYSGDIDLSGLESLREASGPAGAVEDYLFVWGYRPEIYYWSGLPPASRYLSSQPLTGVPADVHYFGGEHRALLDETTTAEARAKLVSDLKLHQPKYVVDELGFFNADLSLEDFPELREFMKKYKKLGATGRFLIYRIKDPVADSIRR
ncbi:MAG TPA: glycosyltransferase family 39 protein [Blastocatellia bacterium]|nr:glycosyltransferase family 39 protein [Blastocatellia bacterium]